MGCLNVLLVVYAFPPAGGVGVLRAASLARYLPADGIRLDVLTTRKPSAVVMDFSLLRDIPPEVVIHRTFTLDLPFGLKKWIKRIVTGSRPPAHKADDDVRLVRPNFLKRALQDLLLPDPQVTWLPFLTRAAFRIVTERNIDIVIVTGAPFSSFLLVERLAEKFPYLAIVVDFRDEWLSTSFDIGSFQFSRSDCARRFAIRAEAAAVTNATAVVAVTEAARRSIRSRYPLQQESKFKLIPNGFDATRLHRSAQSQKAGNNRKIIITYVGTIYASCEPTSFVAGFKSLPPDLKSRFTIRFIGHIEEPHYRKALLQLGDIVELYGHLPQHEALAAMTETDYALLISHDHLNIPAKFYDYIGAGKPILACVHPQGDVRSLLEELRAGWWADSRDVEGIRRLFLDAAARSDLSQSEFQPDVEKIAQYERKILAHRYAGLLHSIAGRRFEDDLQLPREEIRDEVGSNA